MTSIWLEQNQQMIQKFCNYFMQFSQDTYVVSIYQNCLTNSNEYQQHMFDEEISPINPLFGLNNIYYP